MRLGFSFELRGRDVRVWTLRTCASSKIIARYEESLVPDERSRAAQFLLSRARESYILTRAVLDISANIRQASGLRTARMGNHTLRLTMGSDSM
jgi:tellurite resistance protein